MCRRTAWCSWGADRSRSLIGAQPRPLCLDRIRLARASAIPGRAHMMRTVRPFAAPLQGGRSSSPFVDFTPANGRTAPVAGVVSRREETGVISELTGIVRKQCGSQRLPRCRSCAYTLEPVGSQAKPCNCDFVTGGSNWTRGANSCSMFRLRINDWLPLRRSRGRVHITRGVRAAALGTVISQLSTCGCLFGPLPSQGGPLT